MSNKGTERVKRGMAEMQKGGVIMDVVNAEQAKIAEEAGAVAVMALERVPADIRAKRRCCPYGRPKNRGRSTKCSNDSSHGKSTYRPHRGSSCS